MRGSEMATQHEHGHSWRARCAEQLAQKQANSRRTRQKASLNCRLLLQVGAPVQGMYPLLSRQACPCNLHPSSQFYTTWYYNIGIQRRGAAGLQQSRPKQKTGKLD